MAQHMCTDAAAGAVVEAIDTRAHHAKIRLGRRGKNRTSIQLEILISTNVDHTWKTAVKAFKE